MAPNFDTVTGTDGTIPDRDRHVSCQVRPIVDLPDMVVHLVEARMASHYRVVAKMKNARAKRLRKDDLDDLVVNSVPPS